MPRKTTGRQMLEKLSPFTQALSTRKKPADRAPDAARHVSVSAGAGCGKTTTMELGYLGLMGNKLPFKPSDSQTAIIDEFSLTPKDSSIKFVCFNKSIANEFEARGLPGCTNHSLGFAAVRKSLGRVSIDDRSYKIKDAVESSGVDLKKDWDLFRMVEKVTSLSKMTLAGWRPGLPHDELCPPDIWESDFNGMIEHYGIDLNGKEERVKELVPKVLQACSLRQDKVDFDDMVWFPVIKAMPLERFDLLCVDERQDLNACQQALLQRSCERIIAVGDRNQSIYGFSGASPSAFDDMDTWMSSQPRGLVTLPLMETRRCPKAVVALVNPLVPELRALSEAPEGTIVRGVHWSTLLGDDTVTNVSGREDGFAHNAAASALRARPADMLLCRLNAPLIQLAYRLIRRNIPANILGRDIGQGLIALVKRSKAESINALITWTEDQRSAEEAKEQAKKYPSAARLDAINDKYDCLIFLTEACSTVNELIARIERIFPDRADRKNSVVLSSIHRAKGLEAERVYIICPEKLPLIRENQLPWERQQERNLQYVAYTRAKDTLIFTVTPTRKED